MKRILFICSSRLLILIGVNGKINTTERVEPISLNMELPQYPFPVLFCSWDQALEVF